MAYLKMKTLTIFTLILMVLAIICPTIAAADHTEWEAQPMHHIKPSNAVPYATISGNEVVNIKTAYNLQGKGDGTGTTIAIIDAYDYPNVAKDLSAFSTAFGLPVANLEIHKMASIISANSGWGLEIALDVQWAHAIAPGAKILLVEARSNSFSDLLSAVNYARNRADVVAISMSWGGSEFSSQTAYNSYFTSQYGATFFASSGDAGGVISWPSSSANVVSVGGTTLTLSGNVYTETAWSGSGGGVSMYEPKPSYQNSLAGSYRATPDVSYDADPNTGFPVYDTYGYSGWLVVGGTSAGAPQWAAIQAIGKTASNYNFYNIYNSQTLYSADFRDITSGQSGSYLAGPSYDLTTGIGSPLTTNFGAPDFTISASPNLVTINTATTNIATSTINVNAISGFTGTVNFIATPQQAGWTAVPSPLSISDSGSSTLTITAPAGVKAGTYAVTVTGTSGAIVHTTTVNVQVTTPDFSLSANPTSQSIRLGGQGQATIKVNPLKGYTGAVTLTASAPTGITCKILTNPITAGSSGQMTIVVSSSIRTGTYTITISGVDGAAGLTHTTTTRVSVTRR